jgi:transcriptional regulator with XRE-family HTH domain
MSLKTEIAATLRALRQQKQISYENLAGGSLRTTIGYLERAEAGVSLDKLYEIAESLDISLVTFVALCIGIKHGKLAEAVLQEALLELQKFQASGGADLIQDQLRDGALLKRASGKPAKAQNRAAVLTLKAQGKTPAEATKILGLSRTTVSRYWRADHQAND